jgi:hypothetical protein
MKRKRSSFDDEQDTIIEGKFSLDKLLLEDVTNKNGKLRLKVRIQYFWYDLREKRDERRYRSQRAKRGYSDYDVWDIQMWFVRTLRPMLENILVNLRTRPDDLTLEEWKSILEEMVILLKVMDTDDEVFVREYMGIRVDDFHTDTRNCVEKERRKARERFMELFTKWFYDLRY